MEKKPPVVGIILTIIILFMVCVICLCLVAVTGGLAALSTVIDNGPLHEIIEGFTYSSPGNTTPTPTPPVWPTPFPTEMTGNLQLEYLTLEGAHESLQALLQEVVPINDPIDLAERLGGKSNIPNTLPDPNQPYKVGDSKVFWVSNTNTNENFQVRAVLRYLGDHLYFWIEDGVTYDTKDLNKLASTFDKEIYPITQEFFGSEWSPGVDHDPRIYVLYASGLGDSIAGYYSSADQLHPDAHMYSNAHEMFLMNADSVDLGEDYIYGTMAHEFQHMIHWYKDRNEDSWLNEGFSMLSELLNSYDTGGFDYLYSLNPDLQLNDWDPEPGNNGPHYGASFLFTAYFLDRFGEQATKALVAHLENGMPSIDMVMAELGILNPDTGKPYTSTEIFADWAATNYVLDSSVETGRYNYTRLMPYQVSMTDTISNCPSKKVRDVFQFGVNYLEIDCEGEHTITFTGVPQVKLLPVDADYSGNYFYWSNMGDDSNMRLTREFDFTNTVTPITMTYKIWYDLEVDYDYAFLSATVGGNSWQILNTPTCTTYNPSGNSYGCGYNGATQTWITESVDLSQFAGKQVTLRFDYVTDAAVNGVGLALDDIRVDSIDYFTDFEKDDGGWDGEGFVRLQNTLPQTYNVSLIEVGSRTTVTDLDLQDDNRAEIKISIGDDVNKVILVVSGTTPITRQRAIYQYEIK